MYTRVTEFIETLGLGYHDGCAVEALCAWRESGDLKPLERASAHLVRLLELERKVGWVDIQIPVTEKAGESAESAPAEPVPAPETAESGVANLGVPAPDLAFCTRCKRDLPRSAFCVSRARPNGIQCWCKECTRQRRNPNLTEKPATADKPRIPFGYTESLEAPVTREERLAAALTEVRALVAAGEGITAEERQDIITRLGISVADLQGVIATAVDEKLAGRTKKKSNGHIPVPA